MEPIASIRHRRRQSGFAILMVVLVLITFCAPLVTWLPNLVMR